MHYSVNDIKLMSEAVAGSAMFRMGVEKKPLNVNQVMTLMLLSNGQGRHPIMGVHDYDIIDGKPSKKTDAMLRDFLLNNGKVEWHALTDTGADATFSHPQGGSIRITWNIERAKTAGLLDKAMWKKWKRQMFRARTIGEGVRTVFPFATGGFYNTEEMQDMALDPTPMTVLEATETLEAACDRLAAEVAVSTDLNATYAAHADTFARIELERPSWDALMRNLFAARDAELKQPKGENT